MVYECKGCEGEGENQGEIAHKSDCKNRLAVRKVCMESGKPPHVGKP